MPARLCLALFVGAAPFLRAAPPRYVECFAAEEPPAMNEPSRTCGPSVDKCLTEVAQARVLCGKQFRASRGAKKRGSCKRFVFSQQPHPSLWSLRNPILV